MNCNFLTVNVNKTKCMTIGVTNSIVKVIYANQIVENVDNYKYLGLMISNHLYWNAHTNKLYRNLSALAGIFRKIANSVPLNLKKSLYNSMFVSQLLYCFPIYGSSSNLNMNLLQRCQNKALKNLYEKDLFYSPLRLLKELNLLSCMNYYRLFSVSHIHSIQLNQIHSNTQLIIKTHEYDTRRNDLRKHNIHTKTWGENNPYIRAIDLYNNLDQSFKSEHNLTKFKKEIKNHFLILQNG